MLSLSESAIVIELRIVARRSSSSTASATACSSAIRLSVNKFTPSIADAVSSFTCLKKAVTVSGSPQSILPIAKLRFSKFSFACSIAGSVRLNSCLNFVHSSACSLVQVPPSNIIWFNSLSRAVISSTLALPWFTASDRVVTNSGRSTPACMRASPNEPAKAVIIFSCATSSRSFRSLLSVSSKALNFGINSSVSINPLDHATPRLSISLFVALIFSVKSSKASWATLNSSIPSVIVSKNAL